MTLRSVWLVPVMIAALATPVWADVSPPGVEACNGKAVGASCSSVDSGDGTCQNATCSKLKYNCAGVDGWSGSGPCGSEDYACVRCVADDGGVQATGDSACSSQRVATAAQGLALLAAAGLLVWRRRVRPAS
jgi:hypothetical protein